MRKEIWKPIWGYTGLYEISNLGNVRSLNRFVKHRYGYRKAPAVTLRPFRNEWGYLIVQLSKNNKNRPRRVSRLVARHFIPNPLKLPEVNHLKGNKEDNRAWMLEWSSISRNRKHAWEIGLNKGKTVCSKNK